MDLLHRIPVRPQDDVWDIVVIGTGAGGGTAGFNLARLGRSVLFIERGNLAKSAAPHVESFTQHESGATLESGWWPHDVQRQGEPNGKSRAWVGCGIGGSTALFAMVMDRFRPADLTPREFAPEPLRTSLPDSWPVSYKELEPFYREAEALYRVRGTEDPLTPTGVSLLEPPPQSEAEGNIYQTLRQSGLHPYRLHYACEDVPGCDRCFGRLCNQPCRNDAGRICVIPALEHHSAHILPNCRVVKLKAEGRNVRSAVCVWNGNRIEIRARIFILGLHALLTPALLLRSASETFPEGLGNSSGMIGRNLMWHVSDGLLVRFKEGRGPLNALLRHGISLNDFYVHNGLKLGNIHAHAGDVMRFITASSTAENRTDTALFNTIVEDFPYAENRVFPTPGCDDGVSWEYAHPSELRLRSQMLIDAFTERLGSSAQIEIIEPRGGLNGGHTCGTCRFGTDPRSSVLDRDNRLHDLDNVYVIDASFFPSSGGINPSLTIAANSLRVSAQIARR